MICSNCAHANDCVMFQFAGTESPITACYKLKNKKQTNGDKYFRNATDEKIAKYMAHGEAGCHYGRCKTGIDCYECWLDWLKQEVDDGD